MKKEAYKIINKLIELKHQPQTAKVKLKIQKLQQKFNSLNT